MSDRAVVINDRGISFRKPRERLGVVGEEILWLSWYHAMRLNVSITELTYTWVMKGQLLHQPERKNETASSIEPALEHIHD